MSGLRELPWPRVAVSTVRGLSFDPDALSPADLVPDQHWGTRCVAFNVQADPTDAAAAGLTTAVTRLTAAIPHQHAVPRSALHLSVLNLVNSRSPVPLRDKERLWSEKEHAWLQAIDEVARATQPFEVRLSRLVPAPAGILAAAVDSPELVALRTELLLALGLADEPVPELTHVTLMRYARHPPPLAQVRSALETVDIAVTTRVSALRTVREQVYPSLRRETIRDHALAAVRRER